MPRAKWTDEIFDAFLAAKPSLTSLLDEDLAATNYSYEQWFRICQLYDVTAGGTQEDMAARLVTRRDETLAEIDRERVERDRERGVDILRLRKAQLEIQNSLGQKQKETNAKIETMKKPVANNDTKPVKHDQERGVDVLRLRKGQMEIQSTLGKQKKETTTLEPEARVAIRDSIDIMRERKAKYNEASIKNQKLSSTMSEERIHQIISECRDKLHSVLKVKVVRGRKLYKTDLVGKIDPYVRVKFGDDVSTSIVHKNGGSDVDFDWNVSFPFDEKSEASLELIVMDSDKHLPDDVVGSHVIANKELFSMLGAANAFEGEVELKRKGWVHSDKLAGFLQLHIYWETHSSDAFPVPTLHCISNRSARGSIVTSVLDGNVSIFRTWQINLWMVGAVFQGETCGWNQNYKAAQMIYGGGAKAKAARACIRAQHTMLYSKDKGVGSYKEFKVHGLQDFYQMINGEYSISSLGSSSGNGIAGRRYTYVIMPDSTMHFSETSKATAQDFLSKHALHACAQRSVVFAGEFFFDTKMHFVQPALIIDNNSGTFAPHKGKLPFLQALLELNFGSNLPICALDRDDPDLKMYFEANEIK